MIRELVGKREFPFLLGVYVPDFEPDYLAVFVDAAKAGAYEVAEESGFMIASHIEVIIVLVKPSGELAHDYWYDIRETLNRTLHATGMLYSRSDG